MTDHDDETTKGLTRRDFVGQIGLGAAAVAVGVVSCDDTSPPVDGGPDGDADADETLVDSRPFILLITTDQEHPPMWFRNDDDWVDERLPARAFLKRYGVTFTQNHCVAMPCSPSRASLYTGLYCHQHHIYGNCGMDGNHLGNFPTSASILREQGYSTWYCGKSHLASIDWYPCDEAAGQDPQASMSAYGFDRWITAPSEPYIGSEAWPEEQCYDSVGMMYEGEHEDPSFREVAAAHLATDEIRRREAPDSPPWFGVVSFVNPHDIMMYPRFEPMDYETPIRQRPGNWEHFDDIEQWKPTCQAEYIRMYNVIGGMMPHGPRTYVPDEWRGTKWETFADAYLYLMQAVDADIQGVLEACFTLDRSVRDNLIVIFTSDHGELIGAHGQRAKGPNMYEEQQNVPLMIVDFSAPELLALDAFPAGGRPSNTEGGRFVGRLSELRDQPTTLLDVTATIATLGHSDDEEDPESWRAGNPQMMGANLIPLLAADAATAPVMAPDPATEGALAARDHILATCDQTYGTPTPDAPLGWEPVSTAFHIVSIREQLRDASGAVQSDFKLNLHYDWPRDEATGELIEDPGQFRPLVDFEHPYEAELYDLTETEPDLREVTTMIPREIPRAEEREGRLQVLDTETGEWSDLAWPPKWSIGALGRRRVENEFTAADQTANIEVYRRLFDKLVHQAVPQEIRRPMPDHLAEIQQEAWSVYHGNNNEGECDPDEGMGTCPGL